MNINQNYQTAIPAIVNHEYGIVQNIRVCKSMLDNGALTPEEYSSRKQTALFSEYVNPLSAVKPKKSGLYIFTGIMFLVVNLLEIIAKALLTATTDVSFAMTPTQIIACVLSFIIAIAYFMKNDKFISVVWFVKIIPVIVYIFGYLKSDLGIQTITTIVADVLFIIVCVLFGCVHLKINKSEVGFLPKILLTVVLVHRFLLMLLTLGFFNGSFSLDFMTISANLFAFLIDFLPWLSAILLVLEISKKKNTEYAPDMFFPLAAAGNLIMEYKALLDMGAITPEEFEAKRVSLLSKTNQ